MSLTNIRDSPCMIIPHIHYILLLIVLVINFSKTDLEFKDICLLPTKKPAEHVNLVMASVCGEKFFLTNWTIDLLCL